MVMSWGKYEHKRAKQACRKINLVHGVFTVLLKIYKQHDILGPYIIQPQYYQLVGCDKTRANTSEATANLRSQGTNF
jgi:hypothetical protein